MIPWQPGGNDVARLELTGRDLRKDGRKTCMMDQSRQGEARL